MFAHSPAATRAAMEATAGCRRPRWAKLSANDRRAARRSRPGRPRRRRRGRHARQHAARPGARPRHGPARARATAAAGCPARPSIRWPSGRCSTSGPPLPDLPIVGVGGVAHGRRRRRAAAGRRRRRAGRARPPSPTRGRRPGCSRNCEAWAAAPGLAPVARCRGRRPPGRARRDTTASRSRDHLALALDVDSLDDAVALLRRLHPWFAVAKVGLELFTAGRPRHGHRRRAGRTGFAVFADLKLHDIPNDRAEGGAGRRDRTGRPIPHHPHRRRGGDGAGRGRGLRARRRRGRAPDARSPSAVTVLTSDGDAGPRGLRPAGRHRRRRRLPGPGLLAARRRRGPERCYPGAVTVCPGVRPAGASADDQARDRHARRHGAGRRRPPGRRPAGHRPPPILRRAAATVADEVAEALGA